MRLRPRRRPRWAPSGDGWTGVVRGRGPAPRWPCSGRVVSVWAGKAKWEWPYPFQKDCGGGVGSLIALSLPSKLVPYSYQRMPIYMFDWWSIKSIASLHSTQQLQNFFTSYKPSHWTKPKLELIFLLYLIWKSKKLYLRKSGVFKTHTITNTKI